jgi:glutathione S-transferase
MYVLHGVPDWGSQVVHMALAELGVPFRFNVVDSAAGGLTTPAYLALNPFARVPTLETPTGPVFETGAILLVLSERHGALAPPPGAPDRGAFLTWFTFVLNSLHPAAMTQLHPEQVAGAAVQRAVADANHAALLCHLAALEKVAATGVWWLSPDHPSITSLYVAMLLRWIKAFPAYAAHAIAARDYPALHAMARGLQARPALRAVLAAEGLTGPALSDPPCQTAD